MSKSSPENPSENFPGELNPESVESRRPARAEGETTLFRQIRMKTGETLLENTLALIENSLRAKAGEGLSKRLSAKLRQDRNRLNAIKTELLRNVIENQGDDKREQVTERIVRELMAQPYSPEAGDADDFNL